MLNAGELRQLMSDNTDTCTELGQFRIYAAVPFKSETTGSQEFHFAERVGLTWAIHGPRPAGVSCVDVFPGYPAR